jgi:hypothetical protein
MKSINESDYSVDMDRITTLWRLESSNASKMGLFISVPFTISVRLLPWKQ